MFLAVVVLLAACSGEATEPSEIQIGSGTLQSGSWSAWVYDSFTTGVCFEIRSSGRDSERICDLSVDNAGIWRPDAMPEDAELVAGTTTEAAAQLALITLADGTQVEAETNEATAVSPLRFFVMTIPAGAEARQLDVLDASGEILDTQPID